MVFQSWVKIKQFNLITVFFIVFAEKRNRKKKKRNDCVIHIAMNLRDLMVILSKFV